MNWLEVSVKDVKNTEGAGEGQGKGRGKAGERQGKGSAAGSAGGRGSAKGAATAGEVAGATADEGDTDLPQEVREPVHPALPGEVPEAMPGEGAGEVPQAPPGKGRATLWSEPAATHGIRGLFAKENGRSGQKKGGKRAPKAGGECNRSEAGKRVTPDALKVLTKQPNLDATDWF